MIMMQNELEIKEGRIAKLEKSLLQMIDEVILREIFFIND